ncbi:sugar phosphate isomerase/epimerase family protein [Kushneria indalinina]|uniref:D-tagatose 3-epimerase n=1 Tax=Kushneria indalinina DSM 14324 TaxID=1122140 RepID=A0A3D9DT52_9GAMM|nr:sugar phosphate isomerase/epimerase [Kushneria indalinina]REC93950.1 D-tagatose 3-epimerase [Kushneria indalinina DSM 14324]
MGIHALVWTGGVDGQSLERAVRQSADSGYQVLELSLHDLEGMDATRTRRAAEDAGIELICSRGLAFDADVSSDDKEVVARGEALLQASLEMAESLGSRMLCGALYSALGKYGQPVSAQGRANAVEVIRRLADSAAKKGITLGIEVVNRYESNVINTAGQALSLIDEIGRDNLCVHLDTYHMNIEEADLVRPVIECGDRLGYVHIGENHRGYLGSGSIDFNAFFHALAGIGYQGPITFESFSSAVVARGLSNDLGIWRNLWSDSDDLARHAREFMGNQLHATQQMIRVQ